MAIVGRVLGVAVLAGLLAAGASGILFGQYHDGPGLSFFAGIGGAIVGSVAGGVREIVAVLQRS